MVAVCPVDANFPVTVLSASDPPTMA